MSILRAYRWWQKFQMYLIFTIRLTGFSVGSHRPYAPPVTCVCVLVEGWSLDIFLVQKHEMYRTVRVRQARYDRWALACASLSASKHISRCPSSRVAASYLTMKGIVGKRYVRTPCRRNVFTCVKKISDPGWGRVFPRCRWYRGLQTPEAGHRRSCPPSLYRVLCPVKVAKVCLVGYLLWGTRVTW